MSKLSWRMNSNFKKFIFSIIDLAALAVLRTLIFILECLPEKIALKIAVFYIHILFLCIPKLKKTANTNLKLVYPNKTQNQRDNIYKKSKIILASNILGLSRIPRLNHEKIKKEFEISGLENLPKMLKKSSNGYGTLITAMHFDAFEYLIQIPAITYKPFSILGRNFGLPRVDKWWNSRRQMHGNIIFDRKGGYKEIIKRIKDGENVVVLCDQNVKSNHAVFADFFDIPASTTKTIALCAMRTNCKIVIASMFVVGNLEKKKVEFTIEPLVDHNDIEGDKETKIKAITESMHRAFEKQIRKKPESWFWIHRRWKTRPNGEAEDVYL